MGLGKMQNSWEDYIILELWPQIFFFLRNRMNNCQESAGRFEFHCGFETIGN